MKRFGWFDMVIVAVFATVMAYGVSRAYDINAPTGSDIPAERVYHQVTVASLAGGKVRQTHVEVEGFVTYVRTEPDGDLHIRLCDSPKVQGMNREHCIVAECIPALPCPAPSVGQKVAVHGISRWDRENGHNWAEVHPIEKGFW